MCLDHNITFTFFIIGNPSNFKNNRVKWIIVSPCVLVQFSINNEFLKRNCYYCKYCIIYILSVTN